MTQEKLWIIGLLSATVFALLVIPIKGIVSRLAP
jgi:hypothetical protein